MKITEEKTPGHLDKRLRGVRRWTTWLKEKFPRAAIVVADPGVFCSGVQWTLQFPLGSSGTVEVSADLLCAGREEFQKVTGGLEQTGWTSPARLARQRHLRVYGLSER